MWVGMWILLIFQWMLLRSWISSNDDVDINDADRYRDTDAGKQRAGQLRMGSEHYT